MRKFRSHHPAGPDRARRASRGRWLTVTGLGIAIAAVVAIFLSTEFDWTAAQHRIADLNSAALFALMATLPVAGFSVSVVYLVAGAKFGPLLGGAVVAAATAVHLIATHWISRSFLRAPLQRLLERRHYHLPVIPPGENAAVAVMAALVPGVPYFARNYLLALSGVPFRIYFPVCLPLYVARSYVTIFLGDLSGDFSRSKFLILAGVYAVKLGVCALLLARMRQHYRERPVPVTPGPSATESSPGAPRKSAGHFAGSA